MPEHTSPAAALEPFVLLANGAKGAAAISLINQVLEAPSVYVFGELLDHANIADLKTSHAEGPSHLRLLEIFAYGTYSDYINEQLNSSLPKLTDNMLKKIRLLSIASLATRSKLIKYSDLQKELRLDGIRELEDLIIEGTNCNVMRGKLDQKSSHFEVDWAMGRDIKKSDVAKIEETLKDWCESCDGMLACLEEQVNRANETKQSNIAHQKQIEQKVKEIRGQLKAQQQLSEGGHEDPDSRMETDRERRTHTDKKSTKGKGGLRGSGTKGFWRNYTYICERKKY